MKTWKLWERIVLPFKIVVEVRHDQDLYTSVALLRFTDKQYIVRNAAAQLKENPFQEANIFISDDVSRKVREGRKKMKENHLEAIRVRGDLELTFILWSVPARILFKKSDTVKLKSFFFSMAAADARGIESGQG